MESAAEDYGTDMKTAMDDLRNAEADAIEAWVNFFNRQQSGGSSGSVGNGGGGGGGNGNNNNSGPTIFDLRRTLAEKIREVYKDPALAESRITRAKEASQNFSWDRRAQAVHEFVRQVAGKSRALLAA